MNKARDEPASEAEVPAKGKLACPDCGNILLFMPEKRKYWCSKCGSGKVPAKGAASGAPQEGDARDRVMHAYFDDDKLRDANALLFWGIVIFTLVASLLLFWFSYIHNPLEVPSSFQGESVYLGFGPFDSMLGYVGWLALVIGLIVIGVLLWLRDPASKTPEAEKSHKYFRYGLVTAMLGMGAFSVSAVMRGQMVEAEVNLGVDKPAYYLLAFIPGMLLVLSGVALFVVSYVYMRQSDARDARALYFEESGLTIAGDCPACGAATELTVDECDACGQLLTPVELADVRDEMLAERRAIEGPLEGEDIVIPEPEAAEPEFPSGFEGTPEDEAAAQESADLAAMAEETPAPEAEAPGIVVEEHEMTDAAGTADEQMVAEVAVDDAVSKGAEVKTCDKCGGALTFIQQYDAWYCYKCEKYEGE